MQIEVIPSSNIHTFDYALFPEQHFFSKQYIYDQFNNISQAMSSIGREFLEETKTIYEQLNDSNLIRKAKSAIRAAQNILSHNSIGYLDSLEQIQHAQPMMQRYIMAEPTIRELYHQQLCNGYSDSYVDIYPDKVGENHYDYRKVMSGMIIDTEDDKGNAEWVSKNYYDELLPEDRELDVIEKFSIINTWELMKLFMDNGSDPTDISNGSLGK